MNRFQKKEYFWEQRWIFHFVEITIDQKDK